MATSDEAAARTPSPNARTRRDDAGVGMAHPTVVPTNFDPEAPDGRRD